MDLRQMAMTTFVLLQATWSVENSRQLIEQLQPSHVIVRRYDSQDAYYLFSVPEALILFTQASTGLSIREALRLDEQSVTPVVEGDTNAEQAPDQCIVLEGGRLIGLFDVTALSQWSISRRGEGENLPSEELGLVLRSMVAEFPEQVQVQTVFSLLVSLFRLSHT